MGHCSNDTYPENCFLISPCNFVVLSGPSGCGKTTCLTKILKSPETAFENVPSKILFLYQNEQKAYREIKEMWKEKITFVRGWNEDLINNFIDEQNETGNENETELRCVILDDLQFETQNNKMLLDLAVRLIHHKNLILFQILQSLYSHNSVFRTIQRQANLLYLWPTLRDASILRSLNSQVFPHYPGLLTEIMETVTVNPYSYLALDFRPQTPRQLRLRQNSLVDGCQNIFIYIPK